MVFEQDSRIIVNTTMKDEEERQRTVVYWPHAHNTEMVCDPCAFYRGLLRFVRCMMVYKELDSTAHWQLLDRAN